MKTSIFALASALSVVASSVAIADVDIRPAMGGTAISADSAADSATPSWTSLESIEIAEFGNARGDISSGTLILRIPDGFELNTSVTPSIRLPSTGNKDVISASIEVTDSQTLTVTIVAVGSAYVDRITIGSNPTLQVRPVSGASLLQSVNIYRPLDGGTAAINGIVPSADGTTGTSFGLLGMAGGLATQIVFTQQPGNAEVGLPFGQQPIIQTRDQYGNDTFAGLPEALEVVTELVSGTGVLLGTVTNDLGTLAGNGTLTHSDLQINTVGDKQIAVSAAGFLSVTSAVFTVITTQPTLSIALSNALPVLTISGDATQAYAIETNESVDGTWQTLNTVTTDALGLIDYVDVEAVSGNRFYRLLKQ